MLLLCLAKSALAAPLVTEMQPRHGRPGTRVVFTGEDLKWVNAVKLGDAYADWEPLGVVDDEGKVYVFEIHATVPDDATTARPVLETTLGGITMPMPFVVAPRISGFRPARGWPGTIVTIEGINFTGMTSVRFGDRPAQFTVTAATQIRAVVPPGVKEGPITVSHEESATSDEAFTLAGPGPVIDQLDEWVGAPGDSVVIRGVNFTGVTSVWFGNVRAAFTVVADTQLKATVPEAPSGQVTLISARGRGVAEEVFQITRAPVITDMFPLVAAPGGWVKLRGVNFRQIQSVHVGNVQAGGQSTPSTMQLDFTVPLSAATGLVKVANAHGHGLSEVALTLTRAPVIESFEPMLAERGKWVTLRGANFTGATRVLLGNMAVRFAVTAATQIRVDLPLNAATGKLTVQNAFGGDTTFTPLTIIGSGPYVTGFEPNHGVTGTKVKVSGRNLNQTTGVEFSGGKKAKFTVPAPTQLDVFVPADAESGPIKLMSASGEYTTEESCFKPVRLAKPERLAAKPGEGVEFSGRNFHGLTSLNIGGQSVPFEVAGNDKLKFTVGDYWLGGEIELIAPGSRLISTNSFEVLPRIDSFEPVIGPANTMVTIRGSGFHEILFLKFGGGVAEFERKSAKELFARVPPNASTGPLAIITPHGESASEGVFTATAPGDLQMTSSLPRREYRPGQTVKIDSRLVFFGPTVATQVTVTNQLPAGVRLLSADPKPTRMLLDGRTLIYELGRVEPGAEQAFQLEVLPLAKGRFQNVIRATAFEGDVVPTNNGEISDFVVFNPDDIRLGISTDASGLTFTLSWTEMGLPLKVETSPSVPGGPWRELPFEPWTVGDRTFVTMQRFGVQSYFRLRLDLEGN